MYFKKIHRCIFFFYSSIQKYYFFNFLTVVGFVGADWAGELDDQKSTTGYVFLAQGGAISWHSLTQCNKPYGGMV